MLYKTPIIITNEKTAIHWSRRDVIGKQKHFSIPSSNLVCLSAKMMVATEVTTIIFIGQQIKAAEQGLENIKIYGNVWKTVIE